MIERRFSQRLPGLLETLRLARQDQKEFALTELEIMAERADFYFKDHLGSSPVFNARSTLKILAAEYPDALKERRQEIQHLLSRVAHYAELTSALEGAPIVDREQVLGGAFQKSAELWCICCSRYAREDAFFCPACERSSCKDFPRLWRRLVHCFRTLAAHQEWRPF